MIDTSLNLEYPSVEEYILKTRILKDKLYFENRRRLIDFKLNKMNNYEYDGIKLIPGMILEIQDKEHLCEKTKVVLVPGNYNLFVVGLNSLFWNTLNSILYSNEIIKIWDISNNTSIFGKLIYNKNKRIITKKEIAREFNINVEDIEIVD